jgi:UDP-3-O-[3-hydroxymyristoyl] glucosamine N-acyltransferase
VAAATFVSGYPAMPHAEARRMHAHLMRLPETKKRLEAAEARIERLERMMTANGKGDAQA